MSFDLFELQQKILDRLESVRGEILIVGTFDQADSTDESGSPVVAQVSFNSFQSLSQVGPASRHAPTWSFDLYVDVPRASAEHKADAGALFSAALAKLIGWEFELGRTVSIAEGRPSGVAGRELRISFGFTTPVFCAG